MRRSDPLRSFGMSLVPRRFQTSGGIEPVICNVRLVATAVGVGVAGSGVIGSGSTGAPWPLRSATGAFVFRTFASPLSTLFQASQLSILSLRSRLGLRMHQISEPGYRRGDLPRCLVHSAIVLRRSSLPRHPSLIKLQGNKKG